MARTRRTRRVGVVALTLALAAPVLPVGAAHAQTTVLTGSVGGSDPTMTLLGIDEPNARCDGTTDVVAHYDVHPWTGTGETTLSLMSVVPEGGLLAMYVFAGSFDPDDGLPTCVAADDSVPVVIGYDMVPGEQYYVVVVDDTFDQLGGSYSLAIDAPRAPTAPEAPQGVSAVAGDGAATVSWSAPSDDGGSPITGYTATASPGGASCSTSGALSCSVTGLANGTSYTFAVRATNDTGTGPWSTASTAVTPDRPPRAPTAVMATPGRNRLTVSWSAAEPDGGSAVTGYTATAEPGGRQCTTAGATTCTIARLANGTPYTVTVTASNASTVSPASEPSAAVTPRTVPRRPREVTGRPGVREVTISWSAPAGDGGAPITGYEVVALRTSRRCTVGPDARSCSITGLASNRTYTFWVRAANAAGSSPAAALAVTTLPRP